MFSFLWEGAKLTLARNNLSALWVGNCNCFILVFIMNMHPLLLLDNSQSKGSIRVLQQNGLLGHKQVWWLQTGGTKWNKGGTSQGTSPVMH